MSARRRTGAVLALIVAIAAVIGIVLAVDSPSSTSGASTQPQVPGATAVQRRDLVETDTESGTVSYANPQTVYDRLSGTVTWLPSVGQVIKPGQALFRVSGYPVILMKGSTPAYRDLSAADSDGPDILELNRNLVALGFNPDGIVLDDAWQPATTASVEVFQESLGESPTGTLTLGQIVFLPGDQLISAVNTTLGSDGATSAADTSPSGGSPQFVSLTKTTTTPTTTTPASQPKHKGSGGSHGTQTLAALLALLRAESAQLRAETAQLRAAESRSSSSDNASKQNGGGSSNSGSGSSNSGGFNGTEGGKSASAILQTTSTQLIVTVDLDASKQSEARVGEKVTVEMPAGNTVNGMVTGVSSVAQNSSNSGSGNGNSGNSGSGNGNGNANGSSSGATIPVTVTLHGQVSGAGLDQAAVSVNFAQAEANNVLSVPVTALLATSGGGYAVQEAAAPHKLVPVITGLFAAGYVQISGPGIYPGLEVTDSQG